MIEVKRVSKVYRVNNQPVVALDDVSLTINEGDIFGIIGYSGAGKSTLVRLFNQLEKQDNGKIFIDGKDISKLSQNELRQLRTKVTMIFQHFNLLSSKTVSQNIELALIFAGHKDKEKRKQRVNELIELVGLTGYNDSYPSNLSGGQKQRVGIARALANEPKILLCDEATSALDPQTTNSILSLLLEIKQKMNITIVMITHQMEVVKKVCTNVAIMSKGKIIETGTVKEIFNNPKDIVTKNFIQEINKGKIDEQLLKEDYQEGTLLKLIFNHDITHLPILSKVIRRCNEEINIIEASFTNLLDSSFMIIQVIGNYQLVKQLFEDNDVKVEVL